MFIRLWCIFWLQVFRPTSLSMVSQSALQPSALLNAKFVNDIKSSGFVFFSFMWRKWCYEKLSNFLRNGANKISSRQCLVLLSANCFQQNSDQGGTELYYVTVASDLACQLLCQRTDLCQFFVYTSGTSVCQLRYKSTGTLSSSGKTTGPKFCPGLCLKF